MSVRTDEAIRSAQIVAIQVRAEELQPGDLFSTAGPEYWDAAMNTTSVGQKVYVRTNSPCPAGQRDELIYRLETRHEEAER